MIPLEVGFMDLARAIQTPPDRFRRFCHTVLNVRDRQNPSQVSPHDVLVAALSAAVPQAVPSLGEEAPLTLLMKEMSPALLEHASMLEECWLAWNDNPEVPEFHLGIAENQFVTWTGLDEFYHPATGEYLARLPMPPAWATTIHLAAIYFRARNVLKEIEELRLESTRRSDTPP